MYLMAIIGLVAVIVAWQEGYYFGYGVKNSRERGGVLERTR